MWNMLLQHLEGALRTNILSTLAGFRRVLVVIWCCGTCHLAGCAAYFLLRTTFSTTTAMRGKGSAFLLVACVCAQDDPYAKVNLANSMKIKRQRERAKLLGRERTLDAPCAAAAAPCTATSASRRYSLYRFPMPSRPQRLGR